MGTKELVVAIDETGGNRPLEDPTSGFGVGAIIFPAEQAGQLAEFSQQIGRLTEKYDFKYKNVKASLEARRCFVDALNLSGVQLFAFYTSGAGVAKEIGRARKAADRYANILRPDLPNASHATSALMERFLGFMMPCLIRHAHINGYTARVFWDRRTDFPFIENTCSELIDIFATVPEIYGMNKPVRFGGVATGQTSHVVKLAGALAGDIREYFNSHGSRIWRHLCPEGLNLPKDPYRGGPAEWVEDYGASRVATIQHILADRDALGTSETVMLQAYYKNFLKHNESNCRLISFASPDGQIGNLEIENGHRWHIQQLAD